MKRHAMARDMRPVLTAIAIAVVASLVPATNARAEEPSVEYQIKAAYLHKLLLFVDWSDDAPLDVGDTIRIGVIGTDRFGEALDRLAGLEVNGRKLEIQRIESLDAIEGCQVLFVSDSERSRLGDILNRAGSLGILTVGESETFTKLGGVLNFYIDDDTVRFEVNIDTAARTGITVSSRLLRLAKVVSFDVAESDDES